VQPQRTSPHSFWLLLSRSIRELTLFGGGFLLLLLAASFEPFNNELNRTDENPDKVVPGHLDLSQRLGYAVLLGGGIGTINPLNEEAQTNGLGGYNLQVHEAISNCVDNRLLRPNSISNIDLSALTLSIIAAEKYNRGTFSRKLEFFVARLNQILGGKVPDFTYGVAQMRLSHARDILRERGLDKGLSDYDIMEILEDDCASVAIASDFVSRSVVSADRFSHSPEEIIKKVAQEYNGSPSLASGTFLYTQAVTGAYNLISHGNTGDIQTNDEQIKSFCMSFPYASRESEDKLKQKLDELESSGEATTSPTAPASEARYRVTLSEPPEPAKAEKKGKANRLTEPPPPPPPPPPRKSVIPPGSNVKIHLWTEERSPKSFSKALDIARSEWLMNEFANENILRARVHITNLDSPSVFKNRCGEEMASNISFAHIAFDKGK
jgi:hypothetical protein